MLRVVLDTNILISAVLTPSGTPAHLFTRALVESDFTMCVSEPVFAEYEEVLSRPRFRRSREEIQTTLSAVRRCALWIAPTRHIAVCSDPADNIFVECADAAQAHYLVTGNTRHFPPVWDNTQVITPRDLLDKLL